MGTRNTGNFQIFNGETGEILPLTPVGKGHEIFFFFQAGKE